MKPCIILFSVIVLFSCSHRDNLLEQSLILSGENRHELESVIDHFSNNPQKLEAAKWIISNMPGNSYYWSSNIQIYADTINKTILPKNIGDKLWDSIGREGPDFINRKDLTTISASFLISDIDRAFRTWQESPWHDEINFENFKRFVLPYRVGQELLHEGWRDSLYKAYYPIVKDAPNTKEAFERIRRIVKKSYGEWAYKFEYTLDPVTMQRYVSNRCIDRCIFLSSVCRAVGLPVAIDQVGLWTNYSNSSHSWVSLILDDGTYTIVDDDSIAKKIHIVDASTFSLHDRMPDDYPYDAMMMKRYAKIWRSTYFNTFRNRDSIFYKGEDINSYNPKMIDVSAFYGLDNEIIIRTDFKTESVSLNIYTFSQGWIPIMTKMWNGKETSFKNIADSILFLPTSRNNNDNIILGNPFYLSNGKQIEIKVDTLRTVKMSLKRKYPMIARWFNRYLRYKGASFLGSQYADFHVFDTLCCITDIPEIHNSIKIKNSNFYRYVKKISGPLGSSKMENINIFDMKGDQLYSGNEDVIDLGRSYQLGLIEFIPWNDGNFITPGHNYELEYWNGVRWKSLGHKIADGYNLDFDNIPASALLLLHDLTEGKEERPFTIQNGRQIWW